VQAAAVEAVPERRVGSIDEQVRRVVAGSDRREGDLAARESLAHRREIDPRRVVAEPVVDHVRARPETSETKNAGIIGKARLALQRLSPVGHAEAAQLPRNIHPALADAAHWSIQLGTYRGASAAEKSGHIAASLPVARGKPMQILRPESRGKGHLYRARLLNFTPHGAEDACAALRRRKIACEVVRPAAPAHVAEAHVAPARVTKMRVARNRITRIIRTHIASASR
jgi:hypothetical protein